MSRTIVAVLVLAGALPPAACGGDGDGDERGGAPPAATGAAEMAHIHGVGLDPADRSVVVATHSGLFRARDGEDRVERIGDRRQDTMGFTVVGPRRYLGSGHPDLRDLRSGTPPLLGLIESTDGGRTWRPVSLRGRADFHVLRAAGERVYGVNSADGQFLASADGGRTWRRRSPPAAVLDLAVRPERPDEVVASTERGLHVSRDGGATWRPLAPDVGGLIAWAGEGTLVVVGGDGVAHRSEDGGRSFAPAGEIGGEPAALSSAGGELYVALHTNEVKVSTDGGRTWRPRIRPAESA